MAMKLCTVTELGNIPGVSKKVYKVNQVELEIDNVNHLHHDYFLILHSLTQPVGIS